jgi:CBS domain containing-hemolysin-like protein
VRLDELTERLSTVVKHPEVETVSGLILAILERPPLVGDVVEYDGVQLRVMVVDGRGVADAVAVVLPPTDGASPV